MCTFYDQKRTLLPIFYNFLQNLIFSKVLPHVGTEHKTRETVICVCLVTFCRFFYHLLSLCENTVTSDPVVNLKNGGKHWWTQHFYKNKHWILLVSEIFYCLPGLDVGPIVFNDNEGYVLRLKPCELDFLKSICVLAPGIWFCWSSTRETKRLFRNWTGFPWTDITSDWTTLADFYHWNFPPLVFVL